MSNININSFDGGKYTQLLPNANQAISSNYATSARNSDTLDGYHASDFLNTTSLFPVTFLESVVNKVTRINLKIRYTRTSYVQNTNEGSGWLLFLTFNFIPQLVFLFYNKEIWQRSTRRLFKEIVTVSRTAGARFEPICFLGNMRDYKLATQIKDGNANSFSQVSFINTTISWYNNVSYDYQWNAENVNYYYFCLG